MTRVCGTRQSERGRVTFGLVVAVSASTFGLVSLGGSRAASGAASPQLFATPTSLDFGDVVVGATSVAQQVHVTNVGTAAIKLTGTYGTSGPFASTGNCVGATVPKGGSCQLMVTFTPANAGVFSATVTDTLSNVKVNIAVHGTGYAKFRISPTVLDFGDVAVGDISPTQTVKVTNLTSAPIQMSSTSNDLGAFSREGSCQGIVLAPGDSCGLLYVFDPTAVGAATATDAGTWNGQKFSVTLEGNAVPRLQITPTGFDFGAVLLHTHSVKQKVTITNRGAGPLVMNGTNSASGAFAFSQDCQGTNLAPGDSCDMSFTFTPATIGTASSTVTGTSNGQSFSIGLTGYGRLKEPLPHPFRITPTSFDFSRVTTVGTQSAQQVVTITNQTAQNVTMSGSAASVAPFFAATSCGMGDGAILSPGSSCTVRYTFDPSATGTAAGHGTGTYNGQPFSIALSGLGTRKFLITPLALEFGPTLVDSLPADDPVSVTNLSIMALALNTKGIATGAFGARLNCAGGSLTVQPGASCTLDFGFLPTAPGRVKAAVDPTFAGQPFSIALAGLGLADLLVTPTGLAFAPRSVGTKSPAQIVSVHNMTDQALSLDISNGPVPANFLVVNTCEPSLGAGVSCSYSFVFKPTSTGTKVGTFTTTIDGQTVHVALSGKGK